MARIVAISDDAEFGWILERAARGLALEIREASGLSNLEWAAALPGIDALVVDCPDEARAFDAVHRARAAAGRPLRLLISLPSIRRENVVALARAGVWAILLRSDTLEHQFRQRLSALGSGNGGAPPSPAHVAPAIAQRESAPLHGKMTGSATPATAGPAGPSESAQNPAGVGALSELRPAVTRQAMIERLNNPGELPALAPAVREVRALASQSSSSLDDVANAIRKDQALSLRVLRVANSAAMGNGDRVDTVAKAVGRIGLSQVREIVLTVGVIDHLGEQTTIAGLRMDWFWEHALAAALASRQLAVGLNLPAEQCETAFTAGLLHDVGRLVLATMLPDEYHKAALHAERLRLPLHEVERRLFLMDHAEVGATLLRTWRLPPTMATTVSLHHRPIPEIMLAGHRHARPALLLAAANELAHHLLLGHSGNAALGDLHALFEALRVPDSIADGLAEHTRMQMADLKLAILAHASGAPGPLPAAALRRRGPASGVSIRFWPADGSTRWLGEAIQEVLGSSHGPARGIVARIHGKADVIRLESSLPSLDAEAGGGAPVPVITVGPWPQGLEPPGLARRVIARLPAAPHWTDLMNALAPLAEAQDSRAQGRQAA